MDFDNSLVNYGQYKVPDSVDCVNLAVGQPRNELLLLNEFNSVLRKLSTNTNFSLLQYGNISGYSEFRSVLADFLSLQYETKIDSSDLIVSNGITGSLSLLISLFSRPKTKIICEDPTYFLALNIFKDYGFEQIIKISSDEYGMCTEDLFDLTIDPDINYIVYLIPYNQNPTGFSISESRIEKLVQWLNLNSNCKVFSDEVYNLLNFNSKSSKPLYLRNKNIVSLGSFSKIYAPALRLGWISASKEIRDLIVSSGQLDSSGCVNPLSTVIMHELIINGSLLKSIEFWRNFLHTNSLKLYNLIKTELGDYVENIQMPLGGYFLWVKFNCDMEFLSKFMETYKIKFHHGKKFSSKPDASYHARFSFCWYSDTDYTLFVSRLKQLITSNLSKPQIYILGHEGKLGKLIVGSIDRTKELQFSGGLGRQIDLSNVNPQCKNIIVDVSSPVGTEKLITKLLDTKTFVPLIIGTTGELPNDLINQYAKLAPVYLCANFSTGISQFKKIIESIDKSKWAPRIIEKHHIHKVDAPSGTAKLLAKTYLDDGYHMEFDITSIREGEIIGYHELILEGGAETITISHSAKTRNLFADGCVNLILDIMKSIPPFGLFIK
jgi:2-aminoadipate transaminase